MDTYFLALYSLTQFCSQNAIEISLTTQLGAVWDLLEHSLRGGGMCSARIF